MKYEIVGSNMQHLKVDMDEGEKIVADSGTLVSKSVNVVMAPKLAGGIISALERKATGATALLTEFEAKSGEGQMAVAGVFPGKILQITLKDGQRFTVEKGSFLAADTTVKYSIQVMGFGAAFLGGAGLYLLELVGPGNIFVHASGDVIEHDVDAQN
ncbi:MAG: AIM24 family protein, partial [Candidatus Micrarchaeota archaeon]|nr:AIM24 family protein [Candidatus Micrarchaeota archaeon]